MRFRKKNSYVDINSLHTYIAGGYAWQGAHAWQGVCMEGGHAWQGGMHGGGMCGRGACVAGGMCGRGACVVGGMHGRGHACHGYTPPPTPQDTVSQCAGGMHPTGMYSCLLNVNDHESDIY